MELAFFLKDKKTPLLRPRLAYVVGQFTDTHRLATVSRQVGMNPISTLT
jgi:ribosomal protein L29